MKSPSNERTNEPKEALLVLDSPKFKVGPLKFPSERMDISDIKLLRTPAKLNYFRKWTYECFDTSLSRKESDDIKPEDSF